MGADRRLGLGWVVWLITLPAVALLVQARVDQCLATTPGDDCTIVWLLFFGWLVPWGIGIVVLAAITLTRMWQRRHPS